VGFERRLPVVQSYDRQRKVLTQVFIREYALFTANEYIVYEIKMSFFQMMFYLQDRFMPDVSQINFK
jgi:hypothetical protein